MQFLALLLHRQQAHSTTPGSHHYDCCQVSCPTSCLPASPHNTQHDTYGHMTLLCSVEQRAHTECTRQPSTGLYVLQCRERLSTLTSNRRYYYNTTQRRWVQCRCKQGKWRMLCSAKQRAHTQRTQRSTRLCAAVQAAPFYSYIRQRVI